MSKLWARLAGMFTSKTFVGADKAGNRYFARSEQVDGIMKEKRWVVFKGEQEPTSVPVEWICWLNGQRKRAPTPEELAEIEARRERVKLNVARLKKEEDERKGKVGKGINIGKATGPDLKSFIQQFPHESEGNKIEEASDSNDSTSHAGPEDLNKQKTHVPESIRKNQNLQSQLDRVNPLDLGLGNHRHDNWQCFPSRV